MIKIKKGFTLIELIIVVFIIGLLGTIVTISISGAKSKSRDVKRISEITNLQIALDNFNIAEGSYPEYLNPGEPLIGSTTGIVFMSKIPENFSYYDMDCYVDGYEYYYDIVENKYKIAFCLEGKIDNYSSGSKCAMNNKIYNNACEDSSFVCGAQIADSEDNIYDTILIGDQCWFVQNLNIGEMISGTSSQTDNGVYEKYCYGNNSDNCDIYGGLYQWNELMNYSTFTTQGICPTGWHVPTDDDWSTLTRAVISDSLCDPDTGCDPAGTYLKASSTNPISWDGTNTSGFTALPAGLRNDNGDFIILGDSAYFWSSSVSDFGGSWSRYLGSGLSEVPRDFNIRTNGYSVRCLRTE